MNNLRIDSPADENDEDALREYGRQIAMDSLLQELSDMDSKVILRSPAQWRRRVWVGAMAASLVGLASLLIWRGENQQPVTVSLDPRWQLTSSQGADYQVISADHVMLRSGELRLTSTQPAPLKIDTPEAWVEANGTDFFIGHHEPNQQTNNTTKTNNQMKANSITRLLVLAGSVALITTQGKLVANPNEAAIAEDGKAPVKISVKANSTFAFDTYAQLAKENKGKNLFYSPYSISNALLMLAEGARGETAKEIGEVLGLPESFLRVGSDAQQIPWQLSTIRTGQSQLNQSFNADPADIKKFKEYGELAVLSAKLAQERIIQRDKGDSPESRRSFFLNPTYQSEPTDQEIEINKKMEVLKNELKNPVIKVVNSVWADESFVIKRNWEKTVTGIHGAGEVKLADFIGNHEAERERINAWVEEQTLNLIKNALNEESVNSDTRLVLANAIYFNAHWLNPFEAKDTYGRLFHLDAKNTRVVDMMHLESYSYSKIRYAAFNKDGSLFPTPDRISKNITAPMYYPDADGFSMVEMPYRGEKFSMVVIAPNDPEGISNLEAQLNDANLSKWLDGLKERETHIWLPKFEMEITLPNLNQTLTSMGMPSAFDSNIANFSGISNTPTYLSKIVHKAYIKVGELGTEAAAVTIVEPVFTSAFDPKFIPNFSADRPFVYLIRDIESGTILFLGRVMDPKPSA